MYVLDSEAFAAVDDEQRLSQDNLNLFYRIDAPVWESYEISSTHGQRSVRSDRIAYTHLNVVDRRDSVCVAIAVHGHLAVYIRTRGDTLRMSRSRTTTFVIHSSPHRSRGVE